MISNYGIYNNHEVDNTLLILFSDLSVDKSINKDEIEILYHEDKVIGYKIKNFIRYAKIRYSGIIYLPAPPLVDIINLVLNKYHLDNISYKSNSGYFTRLNNGKMMVYCLEGTFLRDHQISKGQYCSYYDLYIKTDNDKELFVIDEKVKENEDFFQMEVK